MIRANARLRQLGLAPLVRTAAAIKRTEWDSLEGRFLSTFQEAASRTGTGHPLPRLLTASASTPRLGIPPFIRGAGMIRPTTQTSRQTHP